MRVLPNNGMVRTVAMKPRQPHMLGVGCLEMPTPHIHIQPIFGITQCSIGLHDQNTQEQLQYDHHSLRPTRLLLQGWSRTKPRMERHLRRKPLW